MTLRNSFRILAEKIKDAYPKLSNEPAHNDHDKIRRNLISDIQQKLAEIYAIVMRESADIHWDTSYEKALKAFPERLKSIFNLLSVIALSIKTKLNLNNQYNVLEHPIVRKIDAVSMDCYQFKQILSGIDSPDIKANFNKGLNSPLEYDDYKIGYRKQLLPGHAQGQILGFVMCTPTIQQQHSSLIINAREELDQNFKVPDIQDRLLIPAINLNYVPEIRQPKSLKQISANAVIRNKHGLFKKLENLPEQLTLEFPDLDIDYQHKFIHAVRKTIGFISFKPSENETTYLNLLLAALETKHPYNAVHPVILKIKQISKTSFLSTFKDHMEPLANAVIALMKQYNEEKKEYVRHFESVCDRTVQK